MSKIKKSISKKSQTKNKKRSDQKPHIISRFFLFLLLPGVLAVTFFVHQAYADTGWLLLDSNGGNSAKMEVTLTWINRAKINLRVNNIAIVGPEVILDDPAQEIIRDQGLQALLRNVAKVHNGEYKHKDLLRVDNSFGDVGNNSGGFLYERDYCGGTKQLIFVPGLYWDTGANNAKIDAKSLNVDDGGCGDLLYTDDMHEGYFTNDTVAIGDTSKRDIWFDMVDDQSIKRVDNDEKFTRGDENNPNKYLGPKRGGCRQRVDIDEASRKSNDTLVLGAFETCDTDRSYITGIRIWRSSANVGKTDEVANPDAGDVDNDGNGSNTGGGTAKPCDPSKPDCSIDRNEKFAEFDTGDLIDKVNVLIQVLTYMVGIVAVGMFILAGIRYSSAGGDPNAVASAKKMILNTVIGLVAFIFLRAFLNWVVPGGVG